MDNQAVEGNVSETRGVQAMETYSRDPSFLTLVHQI